MRSPMLALSVMAMVFTGCSTKSIESTVVEPAAQPVLALTSDRLAAPVLLEVDGESIDAGYPFIGDIDGDRKPDVLMGGENRGRLRIYRSLGGPGEVRLASAQWFDDRVPTGRIPKG